jgi:hypothetical protein
MVVLSGVGAGACCGTDCVRIGAFPGSVPAKRDKLPRLVRGVKRSETASDTPLRSTEAGDTASYSPLRGRGRGPHLLSAREHLYSTGRLSERATGGQNPNPWANDPPASANANWNVSFLGRSSTTLRVDVFTIVPG